MVKKGIDVSLLSEKEKQEYKTLKEKETKTKAEKELKRLRSSQSITSKAFKGLDTLAKPSRIIKTAKLRVPLTPHQEFFRTFMGGRKTFATGENLPVINGALTTGWGLVRHPLQKETGRLFGF